MSATPIILWYLAGWARKIINENTPKQVQGGPDVTLPVNDVTALSGADTPGPLGRLST